MSGWERMGRGWGMVWDRMGWDGVRMGWVRVGWDDVGWELAQKRGVGWDEWVGMDGKGVGYGIG